MERLFWADQIADRVIAEKGKKKIYTVAAGITPSGVIHIGNCREILTVDIAARALKDTGAKVRFIYSWDDYDRLRKVPKNMPKAKELEKYLLKPIVLTPDPFGCHKSYAEHFEKAVEEVLPKIGVNPEFIKQNEMYKKCAYAESIKKALENKDTIRKILNKYRKDPLSDEWNPVRIYCEKCGKEEASVTDWDGKYKLSYRCECGFESSFDFREKGIAKLQWRVDWPMRWDHEKVDFEPAGKEHSTPGGSRTVGIEIIKSVYGSEPPVYQMYDYVIIKGAGGKMSSSIGNVITLNDVLNVYLPEIARFFFAGTKPVKEFAFSFDEDVIKIYEDFYKTERIYFGKEDVSKRDKMHWSRVYEMSCIDRPQKSMPVQPSFRHAATLVNIFDTENAIKRGILDWGAKTEYDKNRCRQIIENAKFWLENHAPDKYKFEIKEKADASGLSKSEKNALKDLGKLLEKPITEEKLYNQFWDITKKNELAPQDFFGAAYTVLIGKEKGPRLAPFIIAIGREKVNKLLKQI